MGNEANKAWNAAHPEKVRESRRKWAEANHEKQNAATRAWNKANPERHKETNQKDYELHREQRLAQQRRHRKEVNDYIERQKLGKVCTMCHKEADPSRLVFHHSDPATKLFVVGSHGGRPIQAIVDEVAKCVLVCRPCHIAHHRPGDGNKKKVAS